MSRKRREATLRAAAVDAVVQATPIERVDAAEHKRLTAQLASADRYTRSVPVVLSTPAAVGDQPAITRWDLTRYLKNPVVMWAHDGERMPIGVVKDLEWDDAVGLTGRIYFASARASELAEQVWNGVLEEVVRAVSVGYDVTGEGAAQLIELSVVPVGLDEDAGTPALNPAAAEAVEGEEDDEVMRKKVREAASALAKHGFRVRQKAAAQGSYPGLANRADSQDLATGEVLRMDRVPIRLDKAKDTPAGGKQIPARLSRTGILVYREPDGTVRRELRLASEIFKADSISTLEGSPVIDIQHHTGMVTPETWKKAALGHTTSVRQDGDKFISGVLHVNDKATLDAIASGDRTEVSCGYKCRLDMTPGQIDGQQYDCVQRDIRYNHVALCPPNRGRAGPEVGLRLDEKAPQWGVSHDESMEDSMTIKVRYDGREVEEGSREHLDAIERVHALTVDKVKLDAKSELDKVLAAHSISLGEFKEKLDKAEGARDGAIQNLEAFKTDAAAKEKKAKDDADKDALEVAKARSWRRKLERTFMRIFAGTEDEEKMDAFFDTATDREVMLKVISKIPGGEKFDAKDKSDEYVQARFDGLVEAAGSSLGRGIHQVVKTAEHLRQEVRTDANNEHPVDKARRERDEAIRKAGQPIAPTRV